MIVVPCAKCYAAVRVLGDASEVDRLVGEQSDFWPDQYPCLECGEVGRAHREVSVEAEALRRLRVRDLSAQDYFAALHGLGTPDEMTCDAVTVTEWLAKHGVRVSARTASGTRRAVVDFLEIDGGVRIYFGSSPRGAVVYRIRRPIHHTKQVIDELETR